MGDLIDATGRFRMATLEADVERADTHPELFDEEFKRFLAKDRLLCKSQRDLSGLRTLSELAKANDIILPPTLEEN